MILEFKNYNKELDSEEKVVLLNPRKCKKWIFFETGWTISNNNIDVPILNQYGK